MDQSQSGSSSDGLKVAEMVQSGKNLWERMAITAETFDMEDV